MEIVDIAVKDLIPYDKNPRRHLGGRLKMTLRVPAAQSGPLRFSFLAGKNAGDCYILDYAVMPFWHKHPLKGFRRVALNCFQIGNWAGKNKP